MFKILVDTCVWLDVAKDPKQDAILGVVEELARRGDLELIVPRIVLDEFTRNRDKVERESVKSLSAHFRIVRDALGRAGGHKRRLKAVIAHLDDAGHKIPLIGGQARVHLDRIHKLLAGSPILEANDCTTIAAARRAVDKRAPFHRGTNAMADAILIEMYGELVRASKQSGVRFAFVTHNKHDFSAEHANQKLPHADIAATFSKIKSLYFLNLAEAMRRVDSSLVTETMIEASWTQELRGLSDILSAAHKLTDQVWYNRHWNLRYEIQQGYVKVVEKPPTDPGLNQTTITRAVLNGAKRAARAMEQRYGKSALGPWDDFEWGMINGELSALRWVLGDEWDMLDT